MTCHKSLWFKILLQLFPLQDNPVIPTDNYPKWLKSHILARFSNSRPPSMYGHVTLSDFPFWALSYDWFPLLSSWESNDSPNIQDFYVFYSFPLLIKRNKERNDNVCTWNQWTWLEMTEPRLLVWLAAPVCLWCQPILVGCLFCFENIIVPGLPPHSVLFSGLVLKQWALLLKRVLQVHLP